MTDLIYTCVFDNYDWVLPPIAPKQNSTHVLITDAQGPAPAGWDRRQVDPAHWGGAAAANRYFKMLGHREFPGFNRTLYVDANIRLLGDSSAYLDTALPGGVAIGLFRHPQRDSVAAEAEACLAQGKSHDADAVAAELAHYAANGFTDQIGLSENTILARRPDAPGLDDAMQMWWDLYRHFASRDQFSLPYVRQKTGLPTHHLEWSFRRPNPYFAIYDHRGRRDINPRFAWIEAKSHDSAAHAIALSAWRGVRALRRTVRNIGKGFEA